METKKLRIFVMMKPSALLILFLGIIFSAAHTQSVLDLAKAKQEITLAGKTEGEFTVEELLRAKGLETSDTTHRINGFAMTIDERLVDSTGKRSMRIGGLIQGKGNEFTQEIRVAIKALRSGDNIYITDIHCYPKYKGWHYCNTLYFKIK